MKQHPIPQNILDIEFKLFTKFTVREFVYMAVGVGFGGIFLYFFTKGTLPGIIAIPIFLVSSGVGIFIGTVPINDQQADIFLRNYIVAITNPTQRVWKSANSDEKTDKEDLKGHLPITTGTMQRGYNEPGTAKIVGAENISSSQFIQTPGVTEQLDKEEAARLASIGTHDIPVPERASIVPQPAPAAVAEAPKPPVVEIQARPTTFQSGSIMISRENLSNLQTTEITGAGLGLKLIKASTSQALPGAIVAVKDDTGKILYAQRTGSDGMVTVSRLLPAGRYSIIVQTQQKIYNHIQMLSDGNQFPAVNITLNE